MSQELDKVAEKVFEATAAFSERVLTTSTIPNRKDDVKISDSDSQAKPLIL